MDDTEKRLPRTAPVWALRLEARAVRAEAQLEAFDEAWVGLSCYLTSPKFSQDNMFRVQVEDVLARLGEMRGAMADAELSAR